MGVLHVHVHYSILKAEITDSGLRDICALDSIFLRNLLHNAGFMTIVLKTIGKTQKSAIAAKLGIEEQFLKVIYRAESASWKVSRLAKLPDFTAL